MSDVDYRLAAEEFYRVLFTKLPAMESHFGDPEAQLNMFEIAMMTISSRAIDDPELIKYLRLLGDQHKNRGISSVQMKVGREAFLAGLEAMGTTLSDENRQRQLVALRKLEQAFGF